MDILGTLQTLWLDSGFAGFFADGGWKNLIMIGVACVLLYLGIVKNLNPCCWWVSPLAVCSPIFPVRVCIIPNCGIS